MAKENLRYLLSVHLEAGVYGCVDIAFKKKFRVFLTSMASSKRNFKKLMKTFLMDKQADMHHTFNIYK